MKRKTIREYKNLNFGDGNFSPNDIVKLKERTFLKEEKEEEKTFISFMQQFLTSGSCVSYFRLEISSLG